MVVTDLVCLDEGCFIVEVPRHHLDTRLNERFGRLSARVTCDGSNFPVRLLESLHDGTALGASGSMDGDDFGHVCEFGVVGVGG